MNRHLTGLLIAICLLSGCRAVNYNARQDGVDQGNRPSHRQSIYPLGTDQSYWPFLPSSTYNYHFAFKDRAGEKQVVIKSTGAPGFEVFYGHTKEDNGRWSISIGHTLPGLGVCRVTDQGIETANYYWLRELTTIQEREFQLLLRSPLTAGEVTKLSAYDGEQLITVTVMGFEDVSVPAGTFENCARIHVYETWKEGNTYNSTFWLAEGIGPIKWIRSTGRTEELISFQPAVEN